MFPTLLLSTFATPAELANSWPNQSSLKFIIDRVDCSNNSVDDFFFALMNIKVVPNDLMVDSSVFGSRMTVLIIKKWLSTGAILYNLTITGPPVKSTFVADLRGCVKLKAKLLNLPNHLPRSLSICRLDVNVSGDQIVRFMIQHEPKHMWNLHMTSIPSEYPLFLPMNQRVGLTATTVYLGIGNCVNDVGFIHSLRTTADIQHLTLNGVSAPLCKFTRLGSLADISIRTILSDKLGIQICPIVLGYLPDVRSTIRTLTLNDYQSLDPIDVQEIMVNMCVEHGIAASIPEYQVAPWVYDYFTTQMVQSFKSPTRKRKRKSFPKKPILYPLPSNRDPMTHAVLAFVSDVKGWPTSILTIHLVGLSVVVEESDMIPDEWYQDLATLLDILKNQLLSLDLSMCANPHFVIPMICKCVVLQRFEIMDYSNCVYKSLRGLLALTDLKEIVIDVKLGLNRRSLKERLDLTHIVSLLLSTCGVQSLTVDAEAIFLSKVHQHPTSLRHLDVNYMSDFDILCFILSLLNQPKLWSNLLSFNVGFKHRCVNVKQTIVYMCTQLFRSGNKIRIT
jgi:hypothetical protein